MSEEIRKLLWPPNRYRSSVFQFFRDEICLHDLNLFKPKKDVSGELKQKTEQTAEKMGVTRSVGTVSKRILVDIIEEKEEKKEQSLWNCISTGKLEIEEHIEEKKEQSLWNCISTGKLEIEEHIGSEQSAFTLLLKEAAAWDHEPKSDLLVRDTENLSADRVFMKNPVENDQMRDGSSSSDVDGEHCQKSIHEIPVYYPESDDPPDHSNEFPKIHNCVTTPLDGSNEVVKDHFDLGTGHQKMFNAFYGQKLDLSSLFGPEKAIYSTAESGSFYRTFTWTETTPDGQVTFHWVTLVIDAREGWCYGFINAHGHFEFRHRFMPYMIHKHWKMLDFSGDYSDNGICPNGLGSTEVGTAPMRSACKVLSGYDGQIPAPEEVRESCCVLINAACETFKLKPSLDCCCHAILSGERLRLDDYDPCLPIIMRKWSRIGSTEVQFLLQKLYNPEVQLEPMFPIYAPGILTIEDALDTVSIFPYNQIPRPHPQNHRTWTWTPKDSDASGEPHIFSRKFVGKWPYVPEMEKLRPLERIIDVEKAIPFAFKQGNMGGIAALDVKTYTAAAVNGDRARRAAAAALNLLKKSLK